jgi:hypothetical protein
VLRIEDPSPGRSQGLPASSAHHVRARRLPNPMRAACESPTTSWLRHGPSISHRLRFWPSFNGYKVSMIALVYGERFDLIYVWNAQDISPQLKRQSHIGLREVGDALFESADGKMISEWAKKRICAWGNLASVQINRSAIRGRTRAGRSSSAAWNGCLRPAIDCATDEVKIGIRIDLVCERPKGVVRQGLVP